MDRKKYKKMIYSIGGWHEPHDFFYSAEILDKILARNNNRDKIEFLEIGVYHGRSFVPMFHYFYDRIDRFYACDIFQDLNQQEIFEQKVALNLPSGYEKKFAIVIENSLKLSSHFPNSSNRFVYCSIDGHHGYEHTLSDLEFCAERLTDDGIILLDDVFQFNWPEVGNAMYDFLRSYRGFSVAYVLYNKVILTRDRRIVDDHYDPALFERQKINGQAVNVAKILPPTGVKKAYFAISDFLTGKPRFQ